MKCWTSSIFVLLTFLASLTFAANVQIANENDQDFEYEEDDHDFTGESLINWLKHLVQASLVIRSLGICSFDYSRTRKQGDTAINKGKHSLA